jgi:tetratricopeptide (TPR) repeat protein
MKRISVLLIAMFLFAGVNLKAQDPVATTNLNYSGLETRLKKSDADILNEKKNLKAKTWTSRAQLLIDIFNVHNDVLVKGMVPAQAKLFLRDPVKIETTQDGANKIETYIYDWVNLKFVNDKLDSWTETKKIHPDPLPEAQKALNEAIKLNTDGKADADILKTIQNLKMGYQYEAVAAYDKKDYKDAHQYFLNILDLNKLPQMNNMVDTILIYYAGRAAYEDKNYKEANRLFEEAAATKFEDPLFSVFRKQSYFANGDTAKGVEVMKEGFMKFPEDQSIMIELINYYLITNQGDEALRLIAVAKAADPKNVSFIFTEGTLYDKMGKFEDAEKAYKTCIEINPEYYDAIFNLGVIYYNKAVKIYEEASRISDNKEFEKIQKQGDEVLTNAIPYMEKCTLNQGTDENSKAIRESALSTLKTIYYRLYGASDDRYKDVVNRINAQ